MWWRVMEGDARYPVLSKQISQSGARFTAGNMPLKAKPESTDELALVECRNEESAL
jgi:hypothetical protein